MTSRTGRDHSETQRGPSGTRGPHQDHHGPLRDAQRCTSRARALP